MKQSKSFFCFLIFFGLCTTIHAQITLTTSGGNAFGISGSVNYTIGQVVYNTYTGTNGSIAQGVQQPFEISVVTAIEGPRGISLDIVVYPNPAKDFVKLKIVNLELEDFKYQLYDINGSLLQDIKVEDIETNIIMSNYSSRTYLLKVIQGNKLMKTFKIIKN